MQLEIHTQRALYLLLLKAYIQDVNGIYETRSSTRLSTYTGIYRPAYIGHPYKETELDFYSWLLSKEVISKEHYDNLVKDKSNKAVGVVDTTNKYQPLFDHMSKEHNVLLTQSEMDEIISIVKKIEL